MKLKTKIVLSTLTVIFLLFGINIVVNSLIVYDEILSVKDSEIRHSLSYYLKMINDSTRLTERSALELRRFGESMYALKNNQQIDFDRTFERYLRKKIVDLPEVLGGGIWYDETYVFNRRKLFGPYAHWDKKTVKTTWEYAEAEEDNISDSDDYLYESWYTAAVPKDWDRNQKRHQAFYRIAPYPYDLGDSIQIFITLDAVMYDQNGKIIGVTTVDWSPEKFKELLKNFKLSDKSFSVLFDKKSGSFLYHPDGATKRTGNKVIINKITDNNKKYNWIQQLDLKNVATDKISVVREVRIQDADYDVYYTQTDAGFILAFPINRDEAYSTITTVVLTSVIIALIVLGVVGVSVLFIVSINIKPVEQIRHMLKEISRGKGDLTKRIAIVSNDEIGQTANYFNEFIDSLNKMFQKINLAVKQINYDTDRIFESNRSLAEGNSTQAASLEEITSSINQINVQIQKNLDNINHTKQIAEKTKISSEDGNDKMRQLVNAMESIYASVDDIKQIVTVMDELASQTDLLALNADIEAARVGKYGQGFGVVANSIKTLAGRSLQAVQETGKKVDNVIQYIENGNELVKLTADKLDAISTEAGQVQKLTNDVYDSSQEQSNAVNVVTGGLNNIEDIVQAGSANAEKTANASETLAAQAESLKQMLAYFKVE